MMEQFTVLHHMMQLSAMEADILLQNLEAEMAYANDTEHEDFYNELLRVNDYQLQVIKEQRSAILN